MSTLLIALVLLFTVAAALGLGVMLGYYAISAILHVMHRHSRPLQEPVLATTSHTSGAD